MQVNYKIRVKDEDQTGVHMFEATGEKNLLSMREKTEIYRGGVVQLGHSILTSTDQGRTWCGMQRTLSQREVEGFERAQGTLEI